MWSNLGVHVRTRPHRWLMPVRWTAFLDAHRGHDSSSRLTETVEFLIRGWKAEVGPLSCPSFASRSGEPGQPINPGNIFSTLAPKSLWHLRTTKTTQLTPLENVPTPGSLRHHQMTVCHLRALIYLDSKGSLPLLPYKGETKTATFVPHTFLHSPILSTLHAHEFLSTK